MHDKLLDQAIETIAALPDELQDELAGVLLRLAGFEQPPFPLTAEEESDLDASMAEAERGESATDEEVRAVWARCGR